VCVCVTDPMEDAMIFAFDKDDKDFGGTSELQPPSESSLGDDCHISSLTAHPSAASQLSQLQLDKLMFQFHSTYFGARTDK